MRVRYRLRYAVEAVQAAWSRARGFGKIRDRFARRRALAATRAVLLTALLLLATMARPPGVEATRSVSFGAATTNPFGLGSEAVAFSRPTFVDIDADGDLDIFVGEHDSGGIDADAWYYENVGSANSPLFASGTANPVGLQPAQEHSCPAFADLDGDGDLDAFVGEYYGNINYYINSGSAASPAFLFTASNPFGLTSVGAGGKTIATPTFVDIDGDGDLDAFVGEYDGTVNYFENTGSAYSPAFASVSTHPFGLTDLGIYSAPAFADLDEDGDLDGFFGAANGHYEYFENTGSAVSPAFKAVSHDPFGLTDVGLMSHPAFADIDGDGDLDAFSGAMTYGDVWYQENLGRADRSVFGPLTANPYGLTDVGSDTRPVFVDIDGDGDLDAFVANGAYHYGGTVHYFENVGSAISPSFTTASLNAFGLSVYDAGTSPTFVDIDGDGDMDCFMGFEYGLTYLRLNIGTVISPTFSSGTPNPYGLTDVGDHAAPSFADLDGDGDLDAFTGNAYGEIIYRQNIGSAVSPAFSGSTANPFGLSMVGSDGVPAFADLDGDGDLDAFIGDAGGDIAYFQNTGSATAPAFASPVDNPFSLVDLGANSAPTLADLDGDGDPEFCSGESDGRIRCFENQQFKTVFLPLVLREN
jgi:hypothetical protein